MRVFLHYKRQSLEQFIEKWIVQNEQYINRSFNFDKNFLELLSNSKKIFEELGETKENAKVSQLQIYFETALKGINPKDLEKLKIGRRNIVWISAFHCLTNLGDILQESFALVDKKLKEAEETIGQVLLSGIQANIIKHSTCELTDDIENAKLLWRQLLKNEQIYLIDKKLRLTIHEQDIFIIAAKLISRIT